MSRILPQQSRYEVYVAKANGSSLLRVTDYVGDSVTLEMDTNRLSTLTFSLRVSDDVEWLSVGNQIRFYGGYIDIENYYESDASRLQNSARFKMMFKGNITRLGIEISEDGSYKIAITAIDSSWSQSAYTNLFYRYPSRDCPRAFAKNKESLRLQDLVSGIISDTKMGEARINLGQNTDTIYTLTSPIVQKNISDWAFLNKLAKVNGCYVWSAIENNNTIIYFVDKSKAIGEQGELEFVYISRAGRGFVNGSFLNQQTSPTAPDKGYEGLRGIGAKLKNNQILLNTISVEISPQIQGMNITRITDFDEETGSSTEKLIQYDENKDEIIYWDLNEAKIKEMNSTPEGAAELSRIQQMGPFGIDKETFLRFYTPITMPKGIISAIDKPFLGVSVQGTCEGNVNIRPQQSYQVHGVPRVTNSGIKSNSIKFFLKSLVHKWDDQGFTTDLEFSA